MEQQEARTEHAATIDLTADDDVPVAPPAARDERRAGGGGPAPPAGMPPMPPLRRSENSESDTSLPDFAAASSSESESEGEEVAAASLEAALRRLTPRMPPLRRSASSASDSSLPDLASASSSASEAESEGSFNLPRLARGQAGSAAFWAGVDNWRRESGITEPRSPEDEDEIMHAMSELAVNVLAASRPRNATPSADCHPHPVLGPVTRRSQGETRHCKFSRLRVRLCAHQARHPPRGGGQNERDERPRGPHRCRVTPPREIDLRRRLHPTPTSPKSVVQQLL